MNYENNYIDGRLTDRKALAEQIQKTFTTEGKKHRILRAVAVFLVCIIIIGITGLASRLLYNGYKDFAVVKGGTAPSVQKPDSETLFTGLDSKSNRASLTKLTGDLTATEIYNLACNACVGVTTSVTTANAFGQTTAAAISGSGFIISTDGYILTNYHVVQAADEGRLEVSVMLFNSDEYTAKIVGRDSDNDIALLKIDAKNLTTVRIGDFSSVKVGETVYAIGNPLGELTYSMTSGIVSALERTITVEENMPISMFQIDAAINSGNSGGPIFDANGEVIGIASAKYSSTGIEGLGFAIPINDAMTIADSLAKYGYVKGRALFGISVTTVSKNYGSEANGACIAAVTPGSCSEKAGLKTGDIVTEIDGAAVASSSDLIAAKKNHKAGETVVLKVYRNGEYLTVSVTLDEATAPASSSGQEGLNNQSHSDFGSGAGR